MQTKGALILEVGLAIFASACGGKTQVEVPNGQGEATTGSPSTATQSRGSGAQSSSISSNSSTGTGRGGAGSQAAVDGSSASAVGGVGGVDNRYAGCSDSVIQRFESLEDLAFSVNSKRAELTGELAQACFQIANDLAEAPASLALPPAIGDVRAACEGAVTAIDAAEVELAGGPTLSRESCGCARDAEAYFDCLDPCESLSAGDTSCHEFCYCHSYCDALSMVEPSCQNCIVSVDVDHVTLAATLETNLPTIYLTLNRADLVSWSADTLVEAGIELGHQLNEDCSAELATPLDALMQTVEDYVPELIELVSEARTVVDAP